MAPPDYRLFPSKAGKDKLAHAGNLYILHYTGKKHTTWYCEKSKHSSHPCYGSVRLENEKITTLAPHQHLPDPSHVQAAVVKSNLYAKSPSSTIPPRDQITQCVSSLPDSVITKLPSLTRMAHTISQKKLKSGSPLSSPQSLEDIEILPELTLTARNEQLLLHDSGPSPNSRTLVFCTPENLKALSRCTIWSVDGTFKTRPLLFKQVWVIHALYKGQFLPFVYCLMSEMTSSAYESIFNVLIQNGVKQPRYIIADFELAESNAIGRVLKNTSVKGCLFHYSQCIYRQVTRLGYSAQYENDIAFCDLIKRFMALPFVRPGDVIQYYDAAAQQLTAHAPEQFCDPFLSYMESVWVGVPGHGRRRNPRYRIEMWNHHQSVIKGLPRTNNAAEGWHNAFHKSFGSSHPTIFKFIVGIKDEQARTTAQIANLDAGQSVYSSPKYKDVTRRLKNIIDHYEEYEPLKFLSATSNAI